MVAGMPTTASPFGGPSVELQERPRERARMRAVSGFDPAELAGVIRGAHLDPVQLDGGRLIGASAHVPLPHAHVDAGCFSAALAMRGALPDAAAVVFVALAAKPGLTIGSTPIRAGDIVRCPAGEVFDAVLPGGTRWVAMQSRSPSRPGVVVPQTVIRPASRARRALVDAMERLFAAMQGGGDHPDGGHRCVQPAADVAAALRHGLETGASIEHPSHTVIRNERRVRTALHYMDARLDEQLTTEMVCEAVGVSQRTLGYAFQKTIGIAPMTYFRARRFTAARKALLRAGRMGRQTVTAIAMEFGFWHLGRFSVEYRSRFGESPSESLHSDAGRVAF